MQRPILAWVVPVEVGGGGSIDNSLPGGPPPGYVGGGPMPGRPPGYVTGGPVWPGGPTDPGYGQGSPYPPHIWWGGGVPPGYVSGGPVWPGGPVDPGYDQGHPGSGHVGGGPMPGRPPGYVGGGPMPGGRPVDPGYGRPVIPPGMNNELPDQPPQIDNTLPGGPEVWPPIYKPGSPPKPPASPDAGIWALAYIPGVGWRWVPITPGVPEKPLPHPPEAQPKR